MKAKDFFKLKTCLFLFLLKSILRVLSFVSEVLVPDL